VPTDAPASVADLGEFGLIDRLAQTLGPSANPNLVIGIGDDAAAWLPSPRCMTVATTDALVAGVHFDLATTSWEDLGWKALAENISDVAAMGCRPRYALVALALPANAPVSGIEAFYRGMRACGERYGCSVIGGDVVRSGAFVIQVTLLGESLPMDAGPDRLLLERSRARDGDAIAVTGPLGGSTGGLRLLLGQATASEARVAEELMNAHRRPMPRVQEGLALVEAGVRCAMDVSDGLLADVGHICERSGVDADLDASRVPLYHGLEAVFGQEALRLALTGGEDYELVCAAPPETIARAGELLAERGLGPLSVIGSIVPRTGVEPRVRAFQSSGVPLDVTVGGWDHFHGG